MRKQVVGLGVTGIFALVLVTFVTVSAAQQQTSTTLGGTTTAIVIGRTFYAVNSTMLQYSYNVVYQNPNYPGSTHTAIVNFLINQTLPTTNSQFTNNAFTQVQAYATRLGLPSPSTGNVVIPP